MIHNMNKLMLRPCAGAVSKEMPLTHPENRQEVENEPFRLAHLTRISREITTTTDLDELHRKVVITARDLLYFDFSSLMLFSHDATGLTMTATVGFSQSMVGTFMLLEGEGLATLVARMGKPDVVRDFREEGRFQVPSVITTSNIQSAVSVPMMLEGNVFGILIGHTLQERHFSREEIA